MPEHTYLLIKNNQFFDIVMNLFACYFLIFGSSFYTVIHLLRIYLINCTILNSKSIFIENLKFIQRKQDKFLKMLFDVSFILICLIGIYRLLYFTNQSVKENPIITTIKFSKMG